MNKFELWFLKRLIKREVKQGDHFRRTTALYALIAKAVRAEFTEDNLPTFKQMLEECHEDSMENIT